MNYTIKEKNDTTCYYQVDQSIDRRLSFIKACHVNYSDSLDSIMAFSFAANKIPAPYNFQRDSLIYEQKDNKITIKILHMVNVKNYELMPWKISLIKDTLFLLEQAKDTSNRQFTSTFRVGEFFYEFKKNKEFNLVVKQNYDYFDQTLK